MQTPAGVTVAAPAEEVKSGGREWGSLHPSFCERVLFWATVKPDQVSNYWLDHAGKCVARLTYAELWNRSTALWEWLVTAPDGPQLQPGDKVLIVFPIGLEFLPAFLACLRAGLVAVSTYPPNPSRLEQDLHGLGRVAEDCDARVALTSAAFVRLMTVSRLSGARWPQHIRTWIATDDVAGLTQLTAPTAALQPWQTQVLHKQMPAQRPSVQSTDLAFLQYTSGSTGKPKGVMVSHQGITYMADWMTRQCEGTSESRGCAWAPQYHDMGLIGSYLAGIQAGCVNYNMSPIDFLRNPVVWLQVVEQYAITITTAPNFGWALAMNRAREKGLRFDLSRLTHACMGGERNMPEVQAAMVSELRISPEAIDVHYGCAEMVLDMCSGGRGFHPDRGVAACGSTTRAAQLGSHIVVVDPETRQPVPDGTEGIILVRSPAKCLGYYGQPRLSAQRFECVVVGREDEGFWYDTHDLGLIDHDQLYVLGRQDDVIIVNARNIYPTDIEDQVNKCLGNTVRPGSTAAVQTAADSITIIVECKPGKQPSERSLAEVAAQVEATHSLLVHACIAVSKGAVPRTTSGKVKRKAVKALVLQGAMSSLVAYRKDGPRSVLKVNVEVGSPLPPHTPTPLSSESWRSFCFEHGVSDMNATLIDNGVDSLRLQRFVDATYQQFNINIEPSAVGTLSARELPLDPDCLSPRAATQAQDSCWQPSSAAWEGEMCLSPAARALWQSLGILLVLLLVSIAVIPSVAVMKLIQAHLPVQSLDPWLVMFSGGPGLLVPLAVLLWMVGFTAVLIACKWLVIGRYKQVCYRTWSWGFWRWWLMDRIADVWMTFVGALLKDTPFLNGVYRLLGASCPVFTCRLQVPIREWDLFSAGSHTTVSGTLLLRCVNQDGVWMAPVHVPADTSVAACQVVQPGQPITPQPLGDSCGSSSYVVQRLLAPVVSLVFFELGLVGGSWATQALSDLPAVRWVACGLCASTIATVLGALLCNACRWTVLVDRVCANSVFALHPWLDWTATSWLWRMYGAQLGLGVVGKLGAISPSDCHRLVAGAACLIPMCHLDTTNGVIQLEDCVSIGLGADVQGRCRLRANSRIFPMSIVPKDTTVERDSLFIGGKCVAGMGNIGVTVNFWRLVRLEIMHWIVTALVRWAPMAAAAVGIVQLCQEIVSALSDWTPYAAVPVTMFVTLTTAAAGWSLLHIVAEVLRGWTGKGEEEFAVTSLRCSVWINLVLFQDVTNAFIKPFINGSVWVNLLIWVCGGTFKPYALMELLVFDRGIREAHQVSIGRHVVIDGGNVAGHAGTAGSVKFHRVELGDAALICSNAHVFQSVGTNVTVAPRSCAFSRALPSFESRRVIAGAPAALIPLQV